MPVMPIKGVFEKDPFNWFEKDSWLKFNNKTALAGHEFRTMHQSYETISHPIYASLR